MSEDLTPQGGFLNHTVGCVVLAVWMLHDGGCTYAALSVSLPDMSRRKWRRREAELMVQIYIGTVTERSGLFSETVRSRYSTEPIVVSHRHSFRLGCQPLPEAALFSHRRALCLYSKTTKPT